MRNGWLSGLRQHHRGVIHAVLLALVLPVLIGLLPKPALSAAEALERDLAVSICDPSGMHGPGRSGPAPLSHDTCILCAVCSAAAGPGLADASAAFHAKPSATRTSAMLMAAAPQPQRPIPFHGPTPRGPPSSPLTI